MTGRVLIVGVVVGVTLGTLATIVTRAQQPPVAIPSVTPDRAAVTPALADIELAYVQIVGLASQLAQCQTEQLATVKQAVELRKDVLHRLETAHPGYTVNWQTGTLVPKKP